MRYKRYIGIAVLLLCAFYPIASQAVEFRDNRCVFEAPLDLALSSLDQLRDEATCYSPLPSIFEVGTANQRVLWWHFEKLDQFDAFLADSTLDLSIFIYKRGILYLRYTDGVTKEIHLSPDASAVYKNPMRKFQLTIPGRSVAMHDIYLGLDLRYNPALVQVGVEKLSLATSDDFLYWMIAGMVIGIQLAMLLYNLALAIQFKFKFHAIYCGLVFFALIYSFLLLGGDTLLFPNINSNLIVAIRLLCLGHLVFFGILFLASFIEEWAISPWVKNSLLLTGCFGYIVAVLSFFFPYGYNTYSMAAFDISVAILVLIIIYLVYSAIRKGSRAAVFLLLAWTPIISAIVYRLGITGGMWQSSTLGELSVPVGTSLEMIVLSIAIADRLSKIILERDRATEANVRLQEEAETDSLTLAGNRRYLARGFTQIKVLTEYNNAELALVLFDIDNFKAINDKWGHDAGDRVLIELVKQIKRISRSHEIFARIGGEEFALLIPGVDSATARVIAERVRNSIENIELHRITPLEEPVTVSLGVTMDKVHGLDYQDLYRHADQALYAAKDSGRNRVVMYEELDGVEKGGSVTV